MERIPSRSTPGRCDKSAIFSSGVNRERMLLTPILQGHVGVLEWILVGGGLGAGPGGAQEHQDTDARQLAKLCLHGILLMEL